MGLGWLLFFLCVLLLFNSFHFVIDTPHLFPIMVYFSLNFECICNSCFKVLACWFQWCCHLGVWFFFRLWVTFSYFFCMATFFFFFVFYALEFWVLQMLTECSGKQLTCNYLQISLTPWKFILKLCQIGSWVDFTLELVYLYSQRATFQES